jgi:hypothetical protein
MPDILIYKYLTFSGIALGYGLDGRGFESWQGLRILLFTTAMSRTAPVPTHLLSNGYRDLCTRG